MAQINYVNMMLSNGVTSDMVVVGRGKGWYGVGYKERIYRNISTRSLVRLCSALRSIGVGRVYPQVWGWTWWR